jgi:dihydroorotate dehydrogenase electron transfer subunit
MQYNEVKILTNKPIGSYHKLTLKLDNGINEKIIPGQFLMLDITNELKFFLNRPFSIFDIRANKKTCEIDIIYKVIGITTELLSKKKRGDLLKIIWPLGNGFKFMHSTREFVFIAGGYGAACLYLAIKNLININKKDIILFIGGKTKNDLEICKEFEKFNINIIKATEDCSCGEKGVITKYVEKYLTKHVNNIEVFACGPHEMLKEAGKICEKKNFPIQVSIETFMACGFGVCMGCAVKTNTNIGNPYRLVCKDGPVFNAKEIF